ncbi:MAG TPA: hypothetical protein VHE30_10155 [Polyangiaceae bacterium]|nr:hypothetical protein [Polyangiaceae bacterium]
MTDPGDRFSRQIRLQEVSAEGQEKLGRSVVEVRGRDGAEIERLYLERAGLGLVTVDADAEPPPFPHAAEFRHAETRKIAAGAGRALHTLRIVLGIEPQ